MKPKGSTTISDCDALPVAPPLSVTLAVSVSIPAAAGVHVAAAVPEPPASATVAGTLDPAIANEAVCVSWTPASVKDAASETGLPTNTTEPGAGEVMVTVGATFRIGTASAASVEPPSLSVTCARAVTPGSSTAGQVVDGPVAGTSVPPPQSNWYANPAATSAAEGSVTCAVRVKVPPSFTGDGAAVSVAVGGTLAIAIVVVSLAQGPFVTQAVSVTVCVAGPSPATIVGLAPVAPAPPPRSQLKVIARPAALVAEPCSARDAPSSVVYGPPALTTGAATNPKFQLLAWEERTTSVTPPSEVGVRDATQGSGLALPLESAQSATSTPSRKTCTCDGDPVPSTEPSIVNVSDSGAAADSGGAEISTCWPANS